MASVPADTKTSHGTVQDIMRPGFHHEPSQYQREKQHSSRVFRQITTKCTSHSYRLIRSFSAWSNIHTLLFLPQYVYTLTEFVGCWIYEPGSTLHQKNTQRVQKQERLCYQVSNIWNKMIANTEESRRKSSSSKPKLVASILSIFMACRWSEYAYFTITAQARLFH